MGKRITVFISHSSEDKLNYIDKIREDLRKCYINVWIDDENIIPGENLNKTIFKDGLDNSDIALLFFTEKSLSSRWVKKEIKHVLREETDKGNTNDVNKIISVYDSKETYEKIKDEHPELTDDLLLLMGKDYGKIELGKLVSAICHKYLSLQNGDIRTQGIILSKDKEIFQKEKDIEALKKENEELKKISESGIAENETNQLYKEFQKIKDSGKIDVFIQEQEYLLSERYINKNRINQIDIAAAFGLIQVENVNLTITQKGFEFFKWLNLYCDDTSKSNS